MMLPIVLMMPAWALLGGFARLDSPGPDGVVGGMVVGGLIGLFFGLVFGRNCEWRVCDYISGPEQREDGHEAADLTEAGAARQPPRWE
jgi:hypothetical protein